MYFTLVSYVDRSKHGSLKNFKEFVTHQCVSVHAAGWQRIQDTLGVLRQMPHLPGILISATPSVATPLISHILSSTAI